VENGKIMSNPITALSEALGAAIYRDLPEFVYNERDWPEWNKLSKEQKDEAVNSGTVPLKSISRRPYTTEVDVIMFNQTWGSTALGYDGIGGSAISDAYTVVVEFLGIYCVYFGCGRLAYKINPKMLTNESYKQFAIDLDSRNLPGKYERGMRYKNK